ncbi:Hsp70 family protein [Methylophaga sp.]|uniref:Hsp70 family protein n=1 Tax=Methylophaga sp. TaxID=2024840 RepID=UPI003A8E319D
MNKYVGIDLGTTNSAICSYDGNETRIWKSPEQNDVTPSVIYIDKRGNKYVGKRAYDSEPHSPDNAAKLFKRVMGTSTPIELSALDQTKTPEECSAEILKVLFGYLPEEVRNDPATGTVITVPAAFNQMQKDATMQAAELAGLGSVALMQEPVAAVMSVMKAHDSDGMFLIYDLGGGTLDIAIAESLGGRVNLLAHGGIAMCGGRDFDRIVMDNIVRPWLMSNFNLPEKFTVDPHYKALIRLALWATERAKIELSAGEDSVISLSEMETRVRDLDGEEIYLDIPINRNAFDDLIESQVNESVEAARETLTKAGLTPHDLQRVVFIGGPTNYKPLRDKVSFELGIPANTDVNPMTAVAEGASLFAESIDWSSQNRARKSNRGKLASNGDLPISFNYIARTPSPSAKIAVNLTSELPSGMEFQVDNSDTGWTSGRLQLQHGTSLDVALSKTGENHFKVFVFDQSGGSISLQNNKIVITRTAATVDAIPASHSVGIEVLEKLAGRPVLEYLVKSGEHLPKKGKTSFKTTESLKAGDSTSINIKLWEGDISDPVTDNRPIGVLKISGSDFDDGVIPAGADLECDYEVLDSGNIVLRVSVPSIGGLFDSRGRNFYSRQEGESDYINESTRKRIIEDGLSIRERLDDIASVVDDPKVDQARQKLQSSERLDISDTDPEKSKQADEQILEAKKLLAEVRKNNLKEIRQLDLNSVLAFYDKYVKDFARPSENTTYENLARTSQRAINNNDSDFEFHLDELKGKNFEILWRQDWFVVERFKWMAQSPHLFSDSNQFNELVTHGQAYLQSDEIDQLRGVIAQLSTIQIGGTSEDDILDAVNIIRG